MLIKQIQIEDFVNYKKPSMFIGMGTCDWKCCVEGGFDKSICQNSALATAKDIDMPVEKIVKLYTNNSITKAIVIGGLEPFDVYDLYPNLQIYDLIAQLRKHTLDDIVIYTGYYPYEIPLILHTLSQFKNIIIKFGRYQLNSKEKYDKVLGVVLASENQYALKLRPNQSEAIYNLFQNDGYCPCMTKRNDNTKCSCKAFRNTESGICHCGIFEK